MPIVYWKIINTHHHLFALHIWREGREARPFTIMVPKLDQELIRDRIKFLNLPAYRLIESRG